MSLESNALTGSFVTISDLWTVRSRDNLEFLFVPAKLLCGANSLNALVKIEIEDLVEKSKIENWQHSPMRFRASGKLIIPNPDIDKKIEYVFGLIISAEDHFFNLLV